MKDYYRADPNYIASPFDFLYNHNDVEISQDDVIQELVDYAQYLNNRIEGDFNLDAVTSSMREYSFAFVRKGLLAFKIKAFKLYKSQFNSFEQFCKQALGVTHWQINRTIIAARVVLELINHGFEVLPQNEAQCRELSKYVGSELVRVWESVIAEIPPHRITAKSIEEFLHPETEIDEEETTVIKLPNKLYVYIWKEALDRGLSIVGLLRETFMPDVEPVPIGKMLAWEKDCENLINEYESGG